MTSSLCMTKMFWYAARPSIFVNCQFCFYVTESFVILVFFVTNRNNYTVLEIKFQRNHITAPCSNTSVSWLLSPSKTSPSLFSLLSLLIKYHQKNHFHPITNNLLSFPSNHIPARARSSRDDPHRRTSLQVSSV